MKQNSGSQAQAAGNSAQILFEASYTVYRAMGMATGQRNYPEITQRGCEARVIGKATTDYTAFVANGKAVQFEIKTWQGKDRHLYSFDGKAGLQRSQQYQMMLEFAPFVPTVYLVLWRHNGLQEWRLYPVGEVPKAENGLLFLRKNGWMVKETAEGWPDWLEVIR